MGGSLSQFSLRLFLIAAAAAAVAVLTGLFSDPVRYGCVGVIVDAKPGAVDFYAKVGFIPVEAVEGQSDARPQPTPMFLAMRAIQGALGTG